MPRNGSGQYSPPASSWNPGVEGNAATTADWNTLLADISNTLTQSVSRDGQSPFTAQLNMGGNRITNVGAPAADSDVLRRQQITKGANIPSAAIISLPIEGSLFDITGTTTIGAIANSTLGRVVAFRFDATLVLVHSNNFQLPNQSSITTSPGDVALFVLVDNNFWACLSYPRATAVPVGHFSMFFMASPPAGYLVCNGTAVSRSGYPALFTALGTLYGPGNGSTTFNLPNMQSEFARGSDPGAGRAVGSTQTSSNLNHTHTFTTNSSGNHQHGVAIPTSGDSRTAQIVPGPPAPFEALVATGQTYLTTFAGAHVHNGTTDGNGTTESRPRNMALLPCIKY